VDRAMRWHAVLVHAGGPMQTDSERTAGRERRDYRITVRGDASQVFVDALECVVVESTGDESTLYCEAVDQAKLQAVFSWLYQRGIEIVSVIPDDNGDAADTPSRHHPRGEQSQ
jgi:hypothetical protein